jgi:hypothetical protein
MSTVEQLQQVPFEPGVGLPEAAEVWWRAPVDDQRLAKIEWLSAAYTTVYVLPFLGFAAFLIVLAPVLAAVSLLCLVHAWVIPELFAHRGARVLALSRTEDAPRGRGFLADLLDRRPAEVEAATGVVVEPGRLGVWVLGDSGALLVRPGGRRIHAFCVGVKDTDLRRSERIAHLLLALRQDERGFATVANHAFAGGRWRMRRRLPAKRRPALDEARRLARS